MSYRHGALTSIIRVHEKGRIGKSQIFQKWYYQSIMFLPRLCIARSLKNQLLIGRFWRHGTLTSVLGDRQNLGALGQCWKLSKILASKLYIPHVSHWAIGYCKRLEVSTSDRRHETLTSGAWGTWKWMSRQNLGALGQSKNFQKF